ncbi:hypothetical protein MKX08_002841 [Trichoderma sp. CBMAI-0020]|nr:hypothetical protein MKX08_002841 [Trichoderma sp. CBMAI-0020]
MSFSFRAFMEILILRPFHDTYAICKQDQISDGGIELGAFRSYGEALRHLQQRRKNVIVFNKVKVVRAGAGGKMLWIDNIPFRIVEVARLVLSSEVTQPKFADKVDSLDLSVQKCARY